MPNILYSLFVTALAYFLHVWLGDVVSWIIPLALIGTLGTALAILLGFRNSAAYDRWWEARKIWGGIVNDSRTWGRQALTLVSLYFTNDGASGEDLKKVQKTLIYRHIAWINALRLQLRGQMEAADWETSVKPFLDQEEYRWLHPKKNRATQLIRKQGEVLQELFENGFIDDFRNIQLDNTLTSFYTLQGKAERIKSTPMVKPYHTWSRLFLNIFIFFLPFGLIPVFDQSNAAWLVFPVTMIMSWIFFVIYMFGEILGEPFENGQQDTPLTAICNTIEIDLRDMLDEPELPEKLNPVDGILM
jgi:putative membrane protein